MIRTSCLRRHFLCAFASMALSGASFGSAPLMAANETPSLDTLSRRLGDQAPACVSFEQHRWMEDLGTELPSTGYFQRQVSGLVWQTLSPVKDRVVLSADNPELPPGLKALLPVLIGLLDGDWDRLERHFQASLSGSLNAWRVELVARDGAVAERLDGIEVRGGDRVDRLAMAFADGDRLTLDLTPADCAALTAKAPGS